MSGVSKLRWIAPFFVLIAIPTESEYLFTVSLIVCAVSMSSVYAFRPSMQLRISALPSALPFNILVRGSMVSTNSNGEKASPWMMPFVRRTSTTSYFVPYERRIFHLAIIPMIKIWTHGGNPYTSRSSSRKA